MDIEEDAENWTEKVINKEVLLRAKESSSIMKTIWHMKHRWLWHVLTQQTMKIVDFKQPVLMEVK